MAKDCEYFHDENGEGGSCYWEQNGNATFREEFNAWFCDHHFGKLSLMMEAKSNVDNSGT